MTRMRPTSTAKQFDCAQPFRAIRSLGFSLSSIVFWERDLAGILLNQSAQSNNKVRR